jgi:uncharacterized cupredoxin-like copper-binding protein
MAVIEQERTVERPEQPVSPGLPPEGPKRVRPVMVVAGAVALVLIFLSVVLAISATDNGTSPGPATQTPPRATPAAVANVGVTLREFTLKPDSSLGRAGRVTFQVTNAGAATHEFVVLRTNTPAGGLLKGAEANEAGNVGEIGDLPSGVTKTVALNLKAGHYALICNLPGHYKAGQYADLVVR